MSVANQSPHGRYLVINRTEQCTYKVVDGLDAHTSLGSPRPIKMSALKTYGNKPHVLTLPDSEDEYMIGSEVGNYVHLYRGSLYKKYPSLWRKLATLEERKYIISLGLGHSNLATNVTLLKASEVEDVLRGDDEKYRATVQETAPPVVKPSKKAATWLPQMPPSAHHLDPVPCRTPVNRVKVGGKRLRSQPLLYGSLCCLSTESL